MELHDALELVLLLGRCRDANFSRAAARWVAQYVQATGCEAVEAELARAGLAAAVEDRAPARLEGARALLGLCRRRGLGRCADILERGEMAGTTG